MTKYISGDITNFFEIFNRWSEENTKEKILIYTFNQDSCIYENQIRVIFKEFRKEIKLLNIYNILISPKYRYTQPKNELFTKWDNDIVKKLGYHYPI